MLGELFTPVETPEAPNRGFFKGLFGGGAQSLDREELCKLADVPLRQKYSTHINFCYMCKLCFFIFIATKDVKLFSHSAFNQENNFLRQSKST